MRDELIESLKNIQIPLNRVDGDCSDIIADWILDNLEIDKEAVEKILTDNCGHRPLPNGDCCKIIRKAISKCPLRLKK